MIYTWILLIFGLFPIALLWLIFPRVIRRYKGSLLAIAFLILLVSIPWEFISIDHIWYYSPQAISGVRFLNLPVEELAFFIVDSLLVGTVALILDKKGPR